MRVKTDRGHWFQTFTGRAFYPLDPQPEDVCIEDIAHHLANICRFGGAVREFYSVAQHSVIVSHGVEPDPKIIDTNRLRLLALMHDAAEAYCGDMVRPIKKVKSLEAFGEIERRIQAAICMRFNLPISTELHDHIKTADDRALATERRDLMAIPPQEWDLSERIEPFGLSIVLETPREAEARFLERFHALASAVPVGG